MKRLNERNHHYFISGFDAWVTDDDLGLATKRFWKESKADRALTYRVPLPPTSTYRISGYAPLDVGAVFIDVIHRNERSRARATQDELLLEHLTKHELTWEERS